MARIEIIIEDATGPDGDRGVDIRIESSEPVMPVKDGTLDFMKATKSQNLAFGMIVETCGVLNANLMIQTEED